RQRGLGVSTATSLVLSVDRHNLEYPTEGKGGGGGAKEMVIAREYFPDTAFWAPVVRTDEKGHAEVTVTLPDNLTTWRLTAQALTKQTEVGRATVDIVSSLALMVRPMVPRFFVIGDEPRLGAVLHNNTGQALKVELSLLGQGMEIEQSDQTLEVMPHGRQVVFWPAKVQAVEEAVLRFTARSGELADVVVLRIPVYHPSTPEVVGTAGEVEKEIVELVRLPQEIDTSLGELTVQLEPSLAAVLQGSLRYLRDYPYGCVEQTVSRFLPDLAVARVLRQHGQELWEGRTALVQRVALALQRLYAQQNLDGGWGWWAGEQSSPELTAYVLLGMVEAQREGLLVDQEVQDQAVAFLQQWLDEKRPDTRQERDRRAFVLYALAEAGQGDLGRTVVLYGKRGDMSLYGEAYLAMALHLLDPEETTRPRTLLNDLVDRAILTATGAHWEEEESTTWAMGSDMRTTAIVLRALTRLQPENELLPSVVRWLVTARETDHWRTTQENAWAAMALADYLAVTQELRPQYHYAVLVNGEQQAAGEITPKVVTQTVRARMPVSALSLGEDNVVSITRSPLEGQRLAGKLYYEVFLRYYLPAEKVRALNRGVIVYREYYLAEDPSEPVRKAKVGDTLLVRITLIAPHDLHYLVLEDPLPAGCEAIDPSLQTSRIANRPELKRVGGAAEEDWWNRYYYWPQHTELRDEKVVLFAEQLSRGSYEYTYTVRCTIPGAFGVMPAVAYEMYSPDVFGRSEGLCFTVEESAK
ncbi:MAG: alpha-2-macroglobulin, partial [Anaerolineae bacterium]|nr:alpha-2-macroglobulin [Anaerolineae bacterium]